jgi:DMSO/TMAO reductase YedYZ molybdopterin-dependent catalytic subunit
MALAILAVALFVGIGSGQATEAATQLAQAGTAVPATAFVTDISGAVEHPASFTLDDLRKLPVSSASIFFHTGHGDVRTVFTGVSLWMLFDKVGLKTDPKIRNEGLHKFIVAKGGDGYYAVIALAEIDPEFGGQQAMVAYEQDGKPLAGARLVMPGDKSGGRYVMNVVSIQLRNAEP